MLIAIGAAAMFIARNYPFGTALRMGPGYFPMLLGGLLILFGLAILASGLRDGRADRRLLVAARADHPAAVARAVRRADGRAPASSRRCWC